MKNTFLPYFLVLSSFPALALAVVEWAPFAIDNVTVQVPQQAIEVDLSSLGQSKAAREELYNGIVAGLLRSQKGVLVATSPFATAGGPGLEIKYKGLQLGTNKMVVKYTRALLVGKINYSFNFIPKDKEDATGTSGNEQRRRFFDSVVVKPKS